MKTPQSIAVNLRFVSACLMGYLLISGDAYSLHFCYEGNQWRLVSKECCLRIQLMSGSATAKGLILVHATTATD